MTTRCSAVLFAAASGKALSSIWHRTNFASIANPVHVSPLPTRFRRGGRVEIKQRKRGGGGKKRKRSSWITPSAACNQRAGNVQRRFIKPIWVFRFRFDLPRRDLCPMLYRIDNIISVGGKKNIPPPRASSSSSSSLRINSLRWLCLRGILDFLRSR